MKISDDRYRCFCGKSFADSEEGVIEYFSHSHEGATTGEMLAELTAIRAERDKYRKALLQLLDQVERGDLTDDLGHKFLLNESVRYAREALKGQP